MEIPGVLHASVGYTGRYADNAASLSPATYQSVCDGDGNTEAVRITFDPAIISYATIVQIFFENPRVPMIYGEQDTQYQIAVWTMDERQKALAKEAALAAGKGGVPVYDFECTEWHEGEERHQNFFGCGQVWTEIILGRKNGK